jgi:cytochrome b561
MSLAERPAGITPYPAAMRVMHWIVAALVLVVLPVGFVIDFIKDESQAPFYMVHESFGFLILWAMLLRLWIRMREKPPSHPHPGPALLHRLACAVHTGLYIALITQPILGFLATNAYGFPLELFGIIPIPSPIGKDPALADRLMSAHVFFGWTILVLLVLHIAGVVYHQAIRRDDTLLRMV